MIRILAGWHSWQRVTPANMLAFTEVSQLKQWDAVRADCWNFASSTCMTTARHRKSHMHVTIVSKVRFPGNKPVKEDDISVAHL